MPMDGPELSKNAANYIPLSPISFLQRAARFQGEKTAIVHGDRRISYSEMFARCRRFADALSGAGIREGDTVAVLAANCPALLEAHYAVPMLGAVVNPLNYRLDAALIAFMLEHGEAKILFADREFHATVKAALALMKAPPRVIDIADAETAARRLAEERSVAESQALAAAREREQQSGRFLVEAQARAAAEAVALAHAREREAAERNARLAAQEGAAADAQTARMEKERRQVEALAAQESRLRAKIRKRAEEPVEQPAASGKSLWLALGAFAVAGIFAVSGYYGTTEKNAAPSQGEFKLKLDRDLDSFSQRLKESK